MLLMRLLVIAFLVCEVAAQSLSGFGGRVRLLEGANSELRFEMQGEEFALPSVGSIQKGGVSFSSEKGVMTIRSSGQPVLLESVVGSWNMELAPNHAVSIEASLPQRNVQLQSASQNRSNLLLSFSDKGSAEMLPGSALDLEFFAGNTYSLRAKTNVVVTTADGQKAALSDLQPPVLGGDLKRVTDARGIERFQRSSPLVQLELSGGANESIHVKAPGFDAALIPDQEKQLTFENGSVIVLRHISARQVLEWHVVKGVCQLGIGGFSCWKSLATSGQSGYLQWNPIRKIIDLSSRADSPIFVQLTGRLHASIGQNATFQYAQFQDCGSFTSSASGGEVYLVNRETGEVTPVINTVSFSEGQAVGSAQERLDAPSHRVTFGWESESRIDLRDSARLFGMSPGQEESVKVGLDELRISFGQNGTVTMAAVTGSFELRPGFVPELSFNLPEGAALALTLDRRRSLFTAVAADNSTVATRVVATGRTYMFLSGSAKLSVVVGQNTFIPETVAAWIFFEGAGGESTFTSGLQPAPLIFPERFDGSRIQQQPVSVIE